MTEPQRDANILLTVSSLTSSVESWLMVLLEVILGLELKIVPRNRCQLIDFERSLKSPVLWNQTVQWSAQIYELLLVNANRKKEL